MGTGSLGKNIQNKTGAIKHTALQGALKIALLTGGKRVIEDHQFAVVQMHEVVNFLNLAAANKEFGIWHITFAGNQFDRISSGGDHEFPKFSNVFTIDAFREIDMHQNGCLAAVLWALKKQLDATPNPVSYRHRIRHRFPLAASAHYGMAQRLRWRVCKPFG